MTLQELREMTANLSGISTSGASGELVANIDNLLNIAQRSLGHDLLVPRRDENFTGVSTPTITLTDRPYTNGIIDIVNLTSKERMEWYSPVEADIAMPDRANVSQGNPKIVEQKPESPGVLYLWPNPSAPVDIVVRYAYVPQPMVAMTDEPWSGQFPEFHDLLALHAARYFAQKITASDALENTRRENPYGPLNNWRSINQLYMERKHEAEAMLLDFGKLRYEVDVWRIK